MLLVSVFWKTFSSFSIHYISYKIISNNELVNGLCIIKNIFIVSSMSFIKWFCFFFSFVFVRLSIIFTWKRICTYLYKMNSFPLPQTYSLSFIFFQLFYIIMNLYTLSFNWIQFYFSLVFYHLFHYYYYYIIASTYLIIIKCIPFSLSLAFIFHYFSIIVC